MEEINFPFPGLAFPPCDIGPVNMCAFLHRKALRLLYLEGPLCSTLHCMQLCAIADQNRQGLLARMEDWAAGGVDFIQLRQKDLDAPQLQTLALQVMETIGRGRSKLLVNIPAPALAGLALAAGADGVHLPGTPIRGAAESVRRIFRHAVISVPCHSLQEVALACQEQVNLILFSPVFEKLSQGPSQKLSQPPQGLEALHRACMAAPGTPVFALGGVTSANAPACVAAGAAGVSGIRLFAGDDWRRLSPKGNDI